MEKRTNIENKKENNVLNSVFSKLSRYLTSILRLSLASALFFILALFASAAGIIVEDGALNVSNNLLIDTNTLFVDSINNKAGIGTASPATVLDVKGKANFTGNFSVGQTSNVFFVDNTSGNVGIGTTTPTKALEINSATGNNILLRYNGDSTAYTDFVLTSAGGLNINSTSSIHLYSLTRIYSPSAIAGAMFDVRDSGGDTRFIVRPDSNISGGGLNQFQFGYDTITLTGANPTTYGSFNDVMFQSMALTAANAGQTVTNAANVYIDNGIYTDGSGGATPTITNNYALWVDAGTTRLDGNTYLAVDSGNVGIGTTSPTHKLHVVGSQNLTGILYYGALQAQSPHAFINNDAKSRTEICLVADDGVVVLQYLKNTGNSYEWAFEPNAAECLNKEIVTDVIIEYEEVFDAELGHNIRVEKSRTEVKKRVFQ